MNEVEDAVLDRIGAGDETGPGDRALRRSGSGEASNAPKIAQAAEVGEVGDVVGDEVGVHGVDTEDDQGVGSGACAGGEESQQHERRVERGFQPFTVSQRRRGAGKREKYAHPALSSC